LQPCARSGQEAPLLTLFDLGRMLQEHAPTSQRRAQKATFRSADACRLVVHGITKDSTALAKPERAPAPSLPTQAKTTGSMMPLVLQFQPSGDSQPRPLHMGHGCLAGGLMLQTTKWTFWKGWRTSLRTSCSAFWVPKPQGPWKLQSLQKLLLIKKGKPASHLRQPLLTSQLFWLVSQRR